MRNIGLFEISRARSTVQQQALRQCCTLCGQRQCSVEGQDEGGFIVVLE